MFKYIQRLSYQLFYAFLFILLSAQYHIASAAPAPNEQPYGPGVGSVRTIFTSPDTTPEGVMGYFLGWFYDNVMKFITALAILSIIISGFQLMMSQGDSDGAGKAKERLMGSILGLVLIILMSVILHTINPDAFTL